MATVKRPKPILKNRSTTFLTPISEDHNYELAIYHATLIQQRKNVEMAILNSIESLIDFPNYRGSDAANPAIKDVILFKKLLKPFQPSDYDSLIEERNINDNCGYALCPNKRIRDNTGGSFRLIGTSGKAKDFKVVSTKELEKWCSEDCARRALYVKAQLNECPGWERVDSDIEIELLNEQNTKLSDQLERLDLNKPIRDAADLALERGDAAKGRDIKVELMEKTVSETAVPPSVDVENLGGNLASMHLSMEGYTPNFKTSQPKWH